MPGGGEARLSTLTLTHTHTHTHTLTHTHTHTHTPSEYARCAPRATESSRSSDSTSSSTTIRTLHFASFHTERGGERTPKLVVQTSTKPQTSGTKVLQNLLARRPEGFSGKFCSAVGGCAVSQHDVGLPTVEAYHAGIGS